jgi:hypothetical protein
MRVLLTSDWHCGHYVGLTPPEFQAGAGREVQSRLWDWFYENATKGGPADLLIVNGDAIDGRGDRSGGTEEVSTDRHTQVKAALEVVKLLAPKKVLMTFGTPYHTGSEEDFEEILCDKIRFELGIQSRIGAHETCALGDGPESERLICDLKHKVGASQIPHGRHTAVSRERLWNLLWAERGQRPKADVVVRSHVHYHSFCGGDGWLALTTPALQGLGSKYGARQCSGTVDIGFIVLDVKSKRDWSWESFIMPLDAQRATVFVA